MTTEAGKRLLDEGWDNFDARPWGSIADHVAAIEAEAVAAALDALAAEVEGLPRPLVEPEEFDAGWVDAIDSVLALIAEARR